jgi:hypothetical protein
MSDTSSRTTLDRLTAVMIVVVTLTLAGGYFLLSRRVAHTGGRAVEGRPNPCAAALLCLNYQFPTINAGDIKCYLLGMGVAVALTALGITAFVKVRDASVVSIDQGDVESFDELGARYRSHNRFPLLVAAQLLAVLYVLWSFASVRWSQAPEIAMAGSTLLAIQFLWALVLANTVGAVGVRYIVRGFLVITLATSLVAVWYYYGRNPTLRAKFPFGNPTFLSACLIPGITLALAWICHAIRQAKWSPSKSNFLWACWRRALAAGSGVSIE